MKNKTDKLLCKFIQKKREKTQINKIRNIKGTIIIENIEMQRPIRDYCE